MQGKKERKTETEIIQLNAIVEGRVQGVGFRAFTQRYAISYGLTGWVRNRWHGTVEVVAEGQRTDLEQLLKIIQRGPFAGTTSNVKAVWNEASGEFMNFRIRMTG